MAEDGTFYPHVPLFAGLQVYTAARTGRRRARQGRQAAGAAAPTHCYPHSWRSKAPVIFRNAPQWFIAMDKPIAEIGGTLREKALDGDRRHALRAARRLQPPALA